MIFIGSNAPLALYVPSIKQKITKLTAELTQGDTSAETWALEDVYIRGDLYKLPLTQTVTNTLKKGYAVLNLKVYIDTDVYYESNTPITVSEQADVPNVDINASSENYLITPIFEFVLPEPTPPETP